MSKLPCILNYAYFQFLSMSQFSFANLYKVIWKLHFCFICIKWGVSFLAKQGHKNGYFDMQKDTPFVFFFANTSALIFRYVIYHCMMIVKED